MFCGYYNNHKPTNQNKIRFVRCINTMLHEPTAASENKRQIETDSFRGQITKLPWIEFN